MCFEQRITPDFKGKNHFIQHLYSNTLLLGAVLGPEAMVFAQLKPMMAHLKLKPPRPLFGPKGLPTHLALAAQVHAQVHVSTAELTTVAEEARPNETLEHVARFNASGSDFRARTARLSPPSPFGPFSTSQKSASHEALKQDRAVNKVKQSKRA